MRKFLSILLMYLCCFSMLSLNAHAVQKDLKKGDMLQLVFSVGQIDNVAGISTTAEYNGQLIKVIEGECTVSGNVVNIGKENSIVWNFIAYDGISFNNDNVAFFTFEVLEDCDISDVAICYDCDELFLTTATPVDADFNSLVTAMIKSEGAEFKVLPIGADDTDTDTSESSESTLDTSTENVSSSTSSLKPESSHTESSALSSASSNVGTSSVGSSVSIGTHPTSSAVTSLQLNDTAVGTGRTSKNNCLFMVSAVAFVGIILMCFSKRIRNYS